MDFKQEITYLIKNQLNINNITIEIPQDSSFGDYSLVCFKLAQEFKKSPVEIAEELRLKIKLPKYIEKIESKGPYLNFFINKIYLAETTINTILKQGKNYGRIKGNKLILIEHTSINPTGPIHIGRMRNAFIGDTLVRLYKSQGYKVSTHFYVNDIGKQVALIAWAKKKTIKPSKELEKQFFKYKNKSDFRTLFLYVPANKEIQNNQNVEEISRLIRSCEIGNKKDILRLRSTAKYCLKGQIESLKRFYIKFDEFDFESKFIENKATESIILRLSKLPEAINLDEAQALNLTKFGFERKGGGTVFARKDGTSVYLTRDLAYHEWKLKKYNNLLTVLGEDHKVEFNELKRILSLLGSFKRRQELNAVFLSFVNLKEGKLSTREGRTVPVDELLNEAIKKIRKRILDHYKLPKDKLENLAEKIAVSAIKYYIIKIQPLKPILFDIDEALSFEGETGPYILYSYVRASKILKKAKITQKTIKFNVLSSSEEIELIKALNKFPEILKNAIESHSPNTIAKYIYNLAFVFNLFYENKPILSTKVDEEKIARLYLTKAFCQTMSNCFDILGLAKVDLM
jgi:arginyl-tRNA synthetase